MKESMKRILTFKRCWQSEFWLIHDDFDIFQIRIDFDALLAQPTISDGTGHPKCNDDKLVINEMEFCGSNMNQHSKCGRVGQSTSQKII